MEHYLIIKVVQIKNKDFNITVGTTGIIKLSKTERFSRPQTYKCLRALLTKPQVD